MTGAGAHGVGSPEASAIDPDEAEHLHNEIYRADLRGIPAAIGLVQLIKELRRSGALSSAAEKRIREAIVGELVHTRPGRAAAQEYGEDTRARLDRLFER